MESPRFDRLSKLLATRWTRRQTLAAGGAGLAATSLLASRPGSAAQDATPAAVPVGTPTDPHLSADTTATNPAFLFVQPFDAATWVPKADTDDLYTLTLTGAAAQTTYFSDRPDRITGLAPTQQFLDGLGFGPDNPPNAALVARHDGSDEQDVLVVELLDPVYDEASNTLTYDAKVLADYGGEGLAHLARQQTDYEAPESFGAGSLFIDDCPDIIESCFVLVPGYDGNRGYYNYVGNQVIGQCWQELTVKCAACQDYSWLCYNNFPTVCTGDNFGTCNDDIRLCGAPACCAAKGGCD